LLLSACSSEPPPLTQVTPAGDLDGFHQVMDFGLSMAMAEVAVTREWVDLGDPQQLDVLDKGWSRTTEAVRVGERFVWAIATEASLSLDLVHTSYKSLYVRCRPYRYPGAPPQTMTVIVNGMELSTVELRNGVHTYKIKVPRQSLRSGRNLTTLRFAYARSPQEQDPSSRDRRTLAAAVVWVGFVEPGRQRDPADQHRPQRTGTGDEWQIEVPSNSSISYSVDLPPGARLDLGYSATGEPSEVMGEILLDVDGSQTVVFSTKNHATTPERHQVDLQHLQGSSVELTFVTRTTVSSADQHAAVIWHHPRLYTSDTRLDSRSNIILIVADTLRADHVSCYGDLAKTPNLDALARSGVRFQEVYCHIPITGPSHSSLMTSRLPVEHGVHNNGQILASGYPTLAEALGRHYRHTAAFVSLGVLKAKFGLNRGFDQYYDDFPLSWFKKAPEINQEVGAWLDQVGETPFFLWVHYSDPHEPYAPLSIDYPQIKVIVNGETVSTTPADGHVIPVPVQVGPDPIKVKFEATGARPGQSFRFRSWRVVGARCSIEPESGLEIRRNRSGPTSYTSMLPATLSITSHDKQLSQAELRLAIMEELNVAQTRERYRLEVEGLDQAVGRLLGKLEELGLRQNSLIVFTSDHGESLGEHNHIGHISNLYNPLVRVPLIMSFPGRLPSGLTIRQPVSHLDLTPTILELITKGPTPSGLRGRSLLQLINGADQPQLPIVAETYKPEAPFDRQALVWQGYKYIITWDRDHRALFHLPDDPQELRTLADSDPARTEQMHDLLMQRLSEIESRGKADEAELSEEDIAQLRALGYIH
jgi:arylsulfatase A-like enzyme